MKGVGVPGRVGRRSTTVFFGGGEMPAQHRRPGGIGTCGGGSSRAVYTRESSHMPPVVPPFLIGLITAPLIKRVVKPLVRGIIKTSVGLTLEVRRAAIEAGEEIQDLTAEVAAEKLASSARTRRVKADGEVTAQGATAG